MDIMVLNGDGIGPEIMDAGTKILKKLNDNFGVNINPVKYDIGARSLDQGKYKIENILEEARMRSRAISVPPVFLGFGSPIGAFNIALYFLASSSMFSILYFP